MGTPIAIDRHIVESLYRQALDLSDRVRAAFTAPPPKDSRDDEDLVRVARSCEGLRTTTRMMHAVAWLLNRRAFQSGEISALQLQRYGRLARLPRGDDRHGEMLAAGLRRLIAETERFYERLERLDHDWNEGEAAPRPLSILHDRLGDAA
jgi:regulator of CtrA degradation